MSRVYKIITSSGSELRVALIESSKYELAREDKFASKVESDINDLVAQ